MPHETPATPIRAAGGLLEQRSADGVRIAVLRRNRYADRDASAGDVSLPKGKAEPGERPAETALREVEEETGCRGRIVGAPFRCEYLAFGVRKVVEFFRMECITDADADAGADTDADAGADADADAGVDADANIDASEVAAVHWLTPREAFARLTYDTERDVVARAYPGVAGARGQ